MSWRFLLISCYPNVASVKGHKSTITFQLLPVISATSGLFHFVSLCMSLFVLSNIFFGFRFPKELEWRDKWLHSLKNSPINLTLMQLHKTAISDLFICSIHFNKEDYMGPFGQLSRHAIPINFLSAGMVNSNIQLF